MSTKAESVRREGHQGAGLAARGISVKPQPRWAEMTITDFATQHRLKTKHDKGDDTTIIPLALARKRGTAVPTEGTLAT